MVTECNNNEANSLLISIDQIQVYEILGSSSWEKHRKFEVGSYHNQTVFKSEK
jgi:hypothetical protein